MTSPAQRQVRAKPDFPPRVNARVLRESHGWTVAQLKDRIAEFGVDISEAHIRNVELGHQFMSPELRAAWAKAFGVKYADLIVPENGNGSAAA